jgi:hypothetical protein
LKKANKERAERAEKAMRHYKSVLYRAPTDKHAPIIYEEDIIDLVTDLLHLQNSTPNKTRAILTLAQMNYEAERK